MRAGIFAVVVAAVLTACGGGHDVSGDSWPHDPGDFSVEHPEIGDPFKSGCAGFVTCYTDCFASSTTATPASCEALCSKTSKARAQGLFDAALACGQAHCVGDADAMNGKCHLVGGALVNFDGSAIAPGDPGTGKKACGACLNDALARLFGDTCANMSSADCNPPECKSATSACLTDTP